ncbi:MAG: TonB-dependent receptor, partial [Chitinophagaceae bacterium]
MGTPGQLTAVFAGTETSLRSRFDGSFGNFDAAASLPGGATLADGTNLTTAKPLDNFFDWDFATVHDAANKLYNTDAVKAGAGLLGDCGDGVASAFCPSTQYDKGTDRQTIETTRAIYAQYNFTQGIFKADVGVRYEKTDVESVAANSIYTGSNWGADTEISFTGQSTAYTAKDSSYSRFLPNIDLQFNVSDDVVLRSSVSKSIARPGYDQIASSVAVGTNFSRTTGYATGTQGNPSLVPYESFNIDFSAEWYYDTSSYASFGVFSKKVSKFISNETVIMNGHYVEGMADIHDPFAED